MLWTVWASLMMGFSMLSACLTALYLRYRSTERRKISSVQWLFSTFFMYLALWCCMRFVYFVWVTLMFEMDEESRKERRLIYNEFDVLGTEAIALLSQQNTAVMTAVMCLGDAALFGVSMSTYPLARELTKLTRSAMDDGQIKERLKISHYCRRIHGFVLMYTLLQIVLSCLANGYSVWNHYSRMFVFVTEIISLPFMTGSLWHLKCRGRKFEPVDGVFIQSPLYTRLKRIMYIYLVFICQFQLALLVSTFTPAYHSTWLDIISGFSLLLYCCTGTALSFTTACSQMLVFQLCTCWFPEDAQAAFLAACATEAATSCDRRDSLVRISQPRTSVEPPVTSPVFVHTDIESSTKLWALSEDQIASHVIHEAMEMHDAILRTSLAQFNGYEITTCGDAFQLAFHSIPEAVGYCLHVQSALLEANWPKALHNVIKSTQRQRNGRRLVFNGLRVRMGIHDAHESDGKLVCRPHAVTGKMTYTGASEVVAQEVSDLAQGGQILITERIAKYIYIMSKKKRKHRNVEDDMMDAIRCQVDHIGPYTIPQCHSMTFEIFQVNAKTLLARKRYWTNTMPLALRRYSTTRALALAQQRPADAVSIQIHDHTEEEEEKKEEDDDFHFELMV